MTPEQEQVAARLGLTLAQKDQITVWWLRQEAARARRDGWEDGLVKPRCRGRWIGHPRKVIPARYEEVRNA